MWLKKDSGLAIDIYVGVCWVAEIVITILCAKVFSWHGAWTGICLSLLIFRIVDIAFVLLSIFVKGFYRRGGDCLSANRLVVLILINALEIMFIFAVLYRGFGIIYPEAAGTLPSLHSFFHSLYFSVVTGTTLGYGTPAPAGWLSQLLTMVETLTILLIVIGVIGYVAGGRRRPLDGEHGHG